ncbi:MAG TPA: Uma2 family endonuclease [Pseudonocardiaceae bacterium]
MDDWRTTPQERLELVDGYFRELPRFTRRHQFLIGGLRQLFSETRPDGCWAVTQVGFEVSVERRIALMPDVVVVNTWSPDDYPVPEQVDLVIEVWSPEDTMADRDYRRRTYASVGIPYFWAVEPDGPVINAYELADGEYVAQTTLSAGTTGTITAAPAPVTLDPARLGCWLDA